MVLVIAAPTDKDIILPAPVTYLYSDVASVGPEKSLFTLS